MERVVGQEQALQAAKAILPCGESALQACLACCCALMKLC